MNRSWRRPVLLLLAALPLALSGAVALSGPAGAADTDIKINEINHAGTDFVELVNNGPLPVDISGFKILDGDPQHAKFAIPSNTSIASQGRLTFENFGWGLGDGDTVTLFAADGTTVLDSFTWTAPGAPASSYGRCPDSTGPIVVTTAVTKGSPNSCAAATVVQINEVESSGGTPGDWVELVNTDSASADLSGLQVKDNDNAHVYTIPAATNLAAGGLLVLEQAQLGFELDDADSVRLFAGDGTTVLDSYTWTFPAATTSYGRCPTPAGIITKTKAPTKGAANSCLAAVAWPGGASVSTVDSAGFFGGNMSGLAYEGTASGTPGTLWAVKNNPGSLYKLVQSGSTWVADAGDWTAGKALHFANGSGNIDAEGVTFAGAGSASGLYVAVERDNAGGGSRPSILRFDPSAAGTSVNATNDWNLSADLPGLGANLGPEAIAWVPDGYLTGKGFKTSGGTAYNPADYPNHGSGLFFVGVEQTGQVYAYALNHSTNGFTRVASFDTGFQAVMELHFERGTQKLWVVCDDTCQGRSARYDVETAAGATQGTFVPTTFYERPAGMGNFNNEGFTTTPRSECVGGVKPVFWADDTENDGHALRAGTLDCTAPVAQTVAFTSTAPTGAVVGQIYTPTTTGGPSSNPVVLSIAPASVGLCSVVGGSVRLDHPGACVIKADQAGDADNLAGTAQQSVTAVKANSSVSLQVSAASLRASVSVNAPGSAPVTGTVDFVVDGSPVGTAPIAGGVATLSYAVPHDGSTHTVTAAYQGSTDLQSSAQSVTRGDPSITAAVTSAGERSATGWYGAPVTVTFTCTPHGSALTAGCPPPVTIGTSGADQSVTRSIQAADGGTASVTVSELDVDLGAPTVTIGGVKAGKAYPTKQKPSCVGADTLSGLAACEVTQQKTGKRVKVTATATDHAGNVTVTTLTYKVKPKRK